MIILQIQKFINIGTVLEHYARFLLLSLNDGEQLFLVRYGD
jgi:hypothetical protein